MSEINEKIKELRQTLKLSQAQFSERIGISRSNLCNIEINRISVTQRTKKTICNEFNVNPEWLDGKSETMFTVNIDTIEKFVNDYNLNENDKEWLKMLIFDFDDDQRNLFYEIAKQMMCSCSVAIYDGFKEEKKMNEMITVFTNKEFGEVRMIEINGIPYFVGKDVAKALGYKNSKDALARHVDEDDKDGVVIHDLIGRAQKTTVITESGVYSLIFSSQLPEAKKFKRWVTTEVLPSIRKTGAYSTRHQDGLYINGHFIPIDIPEDDLSAQIKINELSMENAKLYKQNKDLKRDVKLLGGELNNPTLEEVEAFAEASGIDLTLARKFFYHYDSLGWVSKKISIKSWRSRLNLWAMNAEDEIITYR